MGCWNETCRLTSLPILVNEPIVCCLVSSRYDDECQTSPFFRGTYDEYGCVENVNDGEVEFLLQKILDKKESLQDIAKLAATCLLHNHESGRSIRLWMAHADVFDSVCEKTNQIIEPEKCSVPAWQTKTLHFECQHELLKDKDASEPKRIIDILERDWKEMHAINTFFSMTRKYWNGEYICAGSQIDLNPVYDVFSEVFAEKLKQLRKKKADSQISLDNYELDFWKEE